MPLTRKTESSHIGVGLVGFGLAGKVFHAPVIQAVDGLSLRAIVARHGDEPRDKYPEAAQLRTVDELLRDDSIQLVVIATPNTSHAPLALQCLRAGRDVVIDKPMAVDSTEAALLVKTARAAGRKLSVFHNRRWDGDFQTVQKLLRDNALGELLLFESHFDRFRPAVNTEKWREQDEPGAGLLFDLGPHLLDQAVLLLGEPEGISADVRRERPGGKVEDAFDITLFYPGRRALLRASVMAALPTPRFLLEGTRGTFLKYGLDPQEALLKDGNVPHGELWGEEEEKAWGTLGTTADGAMKTEQVPTLAGNYMRYYENVRDALTGQATLAVTGADGFRAVRLIELARQSSAEGRRIEIRPGDLPPSPDS